MSGGLQRTTNGGASWQTLNAGTSKPARAIVAFPSNTVLLIGPVGVSRAVGGGRFSPVGGKVAFRAQLSDYDLAGTTVFAFGQGTHTLIRSTNEGAKWTAIRMPLSKAATKGKHGKRGTKGSPGVSVRSVAFTSAQNGLLLDTQGRVWSTHDAGRHWTEVLSLGTGEGVQLAFSDPSHGYLSVRAFGGDHGDAYVLRTTDGGNTWHPQEISAGSLPRDGLVASSTLEAAALIDGPANGGEALNRCFFTTELRRRRRGCRGGALAEHAQPRDDRKEAQVGPLLGADQRHARRRDGRRNDRRLQAQPERRRLGAPDGRRGRERRLLRHHLGDQALGGVRGAVVRRQRTPGRGLPRCSR